MRFMPIEPVKIPQNVYVEDRIVGPVTLRQLIILLATGGFSYAIWTAAKNQLGASSLTLTVICWIPFLIGVVFAFVRIQGIGLMRFILLMMEKMEKPTIRQWAPRRGISIKVQYFSAAEDAADKAKKLVVQPHREKLEELSALLDRGPLVAAEKSEAPATALPLSDTQNPQRPVDPTRIRANGTEHASPLDDIFTRTEKKEQESAQPGAKTLQDILPPPATR